VHSASLNKHYWILLDLKPQIGSSTMTIEDFNTTLSPKDKPSGQKKSIRKPLN
jgi:hypothetical protein